MIAARRPDEEEEKNIEDNVQLKDHTRITSSNMMSGGE